jgi:hypothetical protein
MKMPIKEREFSTAIIVVAVIVVIVLGVLQYRWSNQVSEATSIRLADSLQKSMINWHLDFSRAISEVCVALRVDPDSSTPEEWDQYARRYADWKKTTANPNLVAGLYILRFDERPDAQVLRLAPSGLRFEPSGWPPNFGELREDLLQAASKPGAIRSNALTSPETNVEFANRFYTGGPLAGWQFEPRIPALVRSIARRASAGHEPSARSAADWIVIALDQNDIRNNILPALAERYFRGTEGLDIFLGRGLWQRGNRRCRRKHEYLRPLARQWAGISDSYFSCAIRGQWAGGIGRGHVVSSSARCGRGPGLALDRASSPRWSPRRVYCGFAPPRFDDRLWRALPAGDQHGDSDFHEHARAEACQAANGFRHRGFSRVAHSPDRHQLGG